MSSLKDKGTKKEVSKERNEFLEIVNSLGGFVGVAAIFGYKADMAIRNWAKIGFPERHWDAIIEHCPLGWVTINKLHAINNEIREKYGDE